jgi:hypothetical protein
MINRSGISKIRRGRNYSGANKATNIDQLKDSFFIARVKDINLNSDSKLFKQAGGYSGIGFISYQKYNENVSNKNQSTSGPSLARPMFPHHKALPLVNEFVLIFKGPASSNSQQTNNQNCYYLNPLAIWNTPHYNSYPDSYQNPNEVAPSMNKSILDILAGNFQKPSNKTEQISPNGESKGTFVEKGNIHPILPFAGDVILEGRFGNSIRLGNTSKAKGEITNNWSIGSENGQPITILKNGQSEVANQLSEGYIPIVEDINIDPSSLYLTSTQKIPLEISTLPKREGEGATIPFSSIINKPPISPTQFNKPQVILNSGRLLFNTNIDSILFSSQKSIVMESIEDIGIKSRDKNINIIANEGIISIGNTAQEAQNAAVLGTNFMTQFKVVVQSLINLTSALSKEPGLSVAAAQAFTLNELLLEVEKQIPLLLSQKVKIS